MIDDGTLNQVLYSHSSNKFAGGGGAFQECLGAEQTIKGSRIIPQGRTLERFPQNGPNAALNLNPRPYDMNHCRPQGLLTQKWYLYFGTAPFRPVE